ncbi:GNAT family N-acetyltransferase [Mesorhizobium caraganae]|uniref:GNAT family N-acetyltransferase n=1 Tax=Mesorhizobium caraganae TaxID=483206 RepID=UPI00177C3417|nr:GNAT family N-acetyltransferase [Mesorhizobium caraganae]
MVRPFGRQDVGAVLALMRALAVFEGYDDKFRLTEADLVEHGLGPSPRFGVLVAEREDVIVGIAVHYIIPWTYDLKPVVWLKELYVAEAAGGMAVGHALVEQLRQYAAGIGASAIKWTVLNPTCRRRPSTAHSAGSPTRSGNRGS